MRRGRGWEEGGGGRRKGVGRRRWSKVGATCPRLLQKFWFGQDGYLAIVLHQGSGFFLRSARGLEPGLRSAVLRLQHGNQTELPQCKDSLLSIACGGALE